MDITPHWPDSVEKAFKEWLWRRYESNSGSSNNNTDDGDRQDIAKQLRCALAGSLVNLVDSLFSRQFNSFATAACFTRKK